MPNPWDRQPHDEHSFESGALPCPSCRKPTASLKQFAYVDWFVFYFVGVAASETHYRACPKCMRRFIARRAAYNIIPANVFWVLFVLPYGLLLTCKSFRTGHSPEVFLSATPQVTPPAPTGEAVTESADGFPIVVGALLGWVPCVGFAFGLFAFVISLRHNGWRMWAGRWALLSALVAHGVLFFWPR